MNRSSFYRHCCRFNRFRQLIWAWQHAGDVFAASSAFHRDDGFVNWLTGLDIDDVNSLDSIGKS